MDINKMVDELLSSGILENQELGLVLMNAPDMSPEEKKRHIEQFIADYNANKIQFSEEHANIFKSWAEHLKACAPEFVKERVTKI